MKKKALFLMAVIPAIMSFVGCAPKEIYHKVTKINDYIYEVSDYEKLEFDYADRYFKDNYDNWGGGCSAISTEINNKRYVGRNMDLNISEKCAYVVRTKGDASKQEYPTVGLAYTFRDVSPDYSLVESHNGIADQWYKLLPFMCDDVLNDQGLHIEINMRHGEFFPNGEDKFSCEYTTKDPEARRVYMFEVPRYIGSFCKDVTEARVWLLSHLNIYNKPGYWNYAYIISDEDETLLVEIAQNDIFFTEMDEGNGDLDNDKTVAQTNFYRKPDLNYIEDTKTGIGRLAYMQDNINKVTSQEQLFDMMEYINYFQYYSEGCKFDRRSELIGEAGFLTYDYVYNILEQSQVQTIVNSLFGPVGEKTRPELRKENKYWETTFTEVVDVSNKIIRVKVFENIKSSGSTYLKIDLNETIKVESKEALFA